jgi:hypothetical protein
MEFVFSLVINAIAAGALATVASKLMSRSFGQWFAYSFFLLPLAAVHLMVVGFRADTEDNRPRIGAGIVLVSCVLLAFVAYRQLSGFQPEDIESVVTSIRTEFEKRDGVKVLDVKLIREAGNKLTGFVKIDVNGFPIAKPCEATMGDDGEQFVWRCE